MQHKLVKDTVVLVSPRASQHGILVDSFLATIVTDIQIIVKPGGYVETYVTVLRHDDGRYIPTDINCCKPTTDSIPKEILGRYTLTELREIKHYYLTGKFLPTGRSYYLNAVEDGFINDNGIFINSDKLEELMSMVNISIPLYLD